MKARVEWRAVGEVMRGCEGRGTTASARASAQCRVFLLLARPWDQHARARAPGCYSAAANPCWRLPCSRPLPLPPLLLPALATASTAAAPCRRLPRCCHALPTCRGEYMWPNSRSHVSGPAGALHTMRGDGMAKAGGGQRDCRARRGRVTRGQGFGLGFGKAVRRTSSGSANMTGRALVACAVVGTYPHQMLSPPLPPCPSPPP